MNENPDQGGDRLDPVADRWFVARDGQRFGPLCFAQLVAMAGTAQLSPVDMVLNHVAGVWVSAGQVPGLHFASPQPPTHLTESDDDSIDDTLTQLRSEARERRWAKLRELAKWHRWLNLCILGSIVAGLPVLLAKSATQSPLVEIAATVVVIAIVNGLTAFVMFRLSQCLNLNPWFSVVIAFVPFLNLLMLVELDRRSRKTLRLAGIKCGFAGTFAPTDAPDEITDVSPYQSDNPPRAFHKPRTTWTRRMAKTCFTSLFLALLLLVVAGVVESGSSEVRPWSAVPLVFMWILFVAGVMYGIAALILVVVRAVRALFKLLLRGE